MLDDHFDGLFDELAYHVFESVGERHLSNFALAVLQDVEPQFGIYSDPTRSIIPIEFGGKFLTILDAIREARRRAPAAGAIVSVAGATQLFWLMRAAPTGKRSADWGAGCRNGFQR